MFEILVPIDGTVQEEFGGLLEEVCHWKQA